MNFQALKAFPLLVVILVSCRSRTSQTEQPNTSLSSDKIPKILTSQGSEAFLEMDVFRQDPTNRLNYSPMTPCDLFVWAESVWPTLPIDPLELAASYKAALALSGLAPNSYEELTKPDDKVQTKKSVPLDEAIQIVNQYLGFKDADSQLQTFVQSAWQQAIINHGRAWAGSSGYVGTQIEKKSGLKISDAALKECQYYATNIQGGGGNTAMHMVGDYLAHITAESLLTAYRDAAYGFKNQEWIQKLLTSDLSKNVPYLSVVFAPPPPAALLGAKQPIEYDQQTDPRRFVVPTISYRTFKAIWGDPSQSKVKQDLTVKALCYFKKKPQQDYRNRKIPADWPLGIVKKESNWIGSWDSNGVRAYANYEDVEQEEGAPDCAGVDADKPF